MRLGHSDYRKLNEAIAAMYRRAFVVGASQAIAQTVVHALGGFNAIAGSLRGTRVVDCSVTEPSVLPFLVERTPDIARLHPRFQHIELGGQVLLTSDFLSRKEWHDSFLYAVCRPVMPLEDDIGVNMQLPNGNMMSVAVIRESRTFRAEDREILTLLLPHMETLLSPPSLDASSLQGLGLSRREQEVLFWVSEGKKNSEIAQILGIASGTVKRHLENIYQKLGVENRHGAARRALERQRPFG